MSVVIAIKHKNKIYLGCDTQVSTLSNKDNLKGASQKIWHYKDLAEIALGGVGSLRDIQLIQTMDNLFKPLDLLAGTIDFHYLVNDFFTDIYERLLSKHRIPFMEGRPTPLPIIEAELIVAIEDKMYMIGQDGSVIEGDDYLVIGSGEDIATGVLENNKNKKPETRIKEAITACSDKTLFVNSEILITTTERT